MLQILDHLPDEILSLEATELHRVFPGPTLVHLKGRRDPPLFVSVLLHGNERTGYEALRRLLRDYAGRTLPRSLSLFFGNVQAAKFGMRALEGQPDFNRIWMAGTSPEHLMTHQVLEHMRARGVFASIDVHNNTGVNPHYACVNRLDPRFFRLAALFGRLVVYFIRPEGVQTSAFADLCPAAVLECGQVGEASGVDHATQYLETCLGLDAISADPVAAADLDLFHTVATLKVPSFCELGFADPAADLNLRKDLDHLNFTELRAGTLIGNYRPNSEARLVVSDEMGRDVGENYFDYRNGEIRTKGVVTPSMLTLNQQVIRQDCLGYLMERIDVAGIAVPLPRNS